MDAELYLKEQERLCKSYKRCGDCPAFGVEYNEDCRLSIESNHFQVEKALEIVENWSKENPIRTNQDVLEEMFGFFTVSNELGSKMYINHVRASEWLKREYNKPEEKIDNKGDA